MNRRVDDGGRQAESRRILGAVSRETSGRENLAGRSMDYLAARDRDQDDPIEVWGTRIGRWAGVAVVCGMLLILARYLGLF